MRNFQEHVWVAASVAILKNMGTSASANYGDHRKIWNAYISHAMLLLDPLSHKPREFTGTVIFKTSRVLHHIIITKHSWKLLLLKRPFLFFSKGWTWLASNFTKSGLIQGYLWWRMFCKLIGNVQDLSFVEQFSSLF